MIFNYLFIILVGTADDYFGIFVQPKMAPVLQEVQFFLGIAVLMFKKVFQPARIALVGEQAAACG